MSKTPFKVTQRLTRRTETSVDTYMKEVSKIPMFNSPEEEYQCAILAVNGDKQAKDRLITKNLRFVISVAKAYHTDNVLLSDLINEGNIGLIQAAEKYDPSRGIKFYSYAVFYIKRNILDYISEYATPVRMPDNKTSLINKVRRHLSDIEQTHHRSMTIMDLILTKDKKFNEDELLSIMPYMVNVSDSLDTPIEYMDGTENKHELIEEKTFGWADNGMLQSETLTILKNRLDRLTPIERLIIIHRYGLNGEVAKPLNMCGELPDVNMTAERVRQIEKKALTKLKKGEILI
jgi:RNA polymerase primary sigma factor